MEIILFGDWGLGIGDWGLGIGINDRCARQDPQSPIPITIHIKFKQNLLLKSF